MTLQEAKQKREQARANFHSAKAGTKKWRLAEEKLIFWQSKVANLEQRRSS